MRLYRVVHTTVVPRIEQHGFEPVTASENAAWGGEPRTYFWGERGAARRWGLYKIRQARNAGKPRPKLSIVTAEIPELFVHPEPDPTPVAREFGTVYYTTAAIPPGSIVFTRTVR
jgi:hypothetical protein